MQKENQLNNSSYLKKKNSYLRLAASQNVFCCISHYLLYHTSYQLKKLMATLQQQQFYPTNKKTTIKTLHFNDDVGAKIRLMVKQAACLSVLQIGCALYLCSLAVTSTWQSKQHEQTLKPKKYTTPLILTLIFAYTIGIKKTERRIIFTLNTSAEWFHRWGK